MVNNNSLESAIIQSMISKCPAGWGSPICQRSNTRISIERDIRYDQYWVDCVIYIPDYDPRYFAPVTPPTPNSYSFAALSYSERDRILAILLRQSISAKTIIMAEDSSSLIEFVTENLLRDAHIVQVDLFLSSIGWTFERAD